MSAKLHEEDYQFVIRSVAGVVFLGTPHRGYKSKSKASVIASIASAVSHGKHSNLLEDVEKDSEMLADLLHDFTRTVNTISIPLFCFFEQHKSDIAEILKFKGSKRFMPSAVVSVGILHVVPWLKERNQDAVVDEYSGCLDGHPKLGLASDHFHLNKFSDPGNSNYRLVCEEVVKFVESAPNRVNGRKICKHVRCQC